jgi:hypothetical protein
MPGGLGWGTSSGPGSLMPCPGVTVRIRVRSVLLEGGGRVRSCSSIEQGHRGRTVHGRPPPGVARRRHTLPGLPTHGCTFVDAWTSDSLQGHPAHLPLRVLTPVPGPQRSSARPGNRQSSSSGSTAPPRWKLWPALPAGVTRPGRNESRNGCVRADHRVGAENPATPCDLHLLVYEAAPSRSCRVGAWGLSRWRARVAAAAAAFSEGSRSGLAYGIA